MCEMEFKKSADLTFLVIFNLKVIICQILNLPHTYDNYQTLHMVHKPIPIIRTTSFNKYYKFHKDL
jgi:hypothetical protein